MFFLFLIENQLSVTYRHIISVGKSNGHCASTTTAWRCCSADIDTNLYHKCTSVDFEAIRRMFTKHYFEDGHDNLFLR